MGQPTQRAINYTARSNIDTAQIFLHANGQRPKRASIRQRSRRRQRRGEPHTEHGLGVLRFFRKRRPSHDPKAQSRHRRNDPSTYHIAVLTHFRRRPREAPTGTGPLGTGTRLGAMLDGPRHRSWSYCLDTATIHPHGRQNSLASFHCGNGTCTMVLHDGRTGRAAITMPDRYAVCAQGVGTSRVSQDRLQDLHWAPGPAGARCIHLGEKLRGAELGL